MPDKNVLITGASRGIGYELAREFARNKYPLILVARDRAKLVEVTKELREKFGVPVTPFVEDLSVPGNAEQLMAALESQSIDVDILVNNAGIGVYGTFAETDIDREMKMLQVNLVALTQLTKFCLRGMLARGYGKIMNVASTAAFQPGPLMSVYYASKAYVLSFSEAISFELRKTPVTVTVLCPGPTRTDFLKRASIVRNRLFDFLSMSSGRVAREGYRGLMQGKSLVVPGFLNRMGIVAARSAPRGIVKRVLHWLQKNIIEP